MIKNYKFNFIWDGLPFFNFKNRKIYSEYLREESCSAVNYLSSNSCDILKIKESEILENPNETFYFVFSTFDLTYDYLIEILKLDEYFSKKFIDIIKYKNVKTILIDIHEIHPAESINSFVNYLKKLKVNLKNIYIINNDSKLNDFKNEYNWNINVYKTNHLVSHLCGRYLEYEYEFVKEKKGPFLLCKNKVGKPHRIFTLSFLDEYGILNDTNYSLLDSNTYSNYYFHEDNILKNKKSSLKNVKKFININPILTINEQNRNDFFDENIFINFAGDFNVEDYKHSYVNITTESVFYTNNIHVSEKSFKPFAFYQIPIFIASKGHCNILKNYYKMDLFEDLVDISYDNETDNSKRFFMAFDEIKKIHQNKEKVKKYYIENKHRFEYNRNRVKEISKHGIDIEIFKSIIENKNNEL